MFTGLIQQQVRLSQPLSQGVLTLPCIADDIALGESVSVNGVCLTVVSCDQTHMTFDVSPETLTKTNLAMLKADADVNIERAMRAGDRLGGHFVQGHVDACVKLVSQCQVENYWELTFGGVLEEHQPYLLPKGSVTLNGVSLTVNQIEAEGFSVMIIPETQARTNLLAISPGSLVNIEYDMLVKSIQRSMQLMQERST